MRGIFEKELLDQDDEVLNEAIEVQISMRNLPQLQAGKFAKCEICQKKHAKGDDFCELTLNDTEINESAENAKNFTLSQVTDLMKHKRPVILAVILKSNPQN